MQQAFVVQQLGAAEPSTMAPYTHLPPAPPGMAYLVPLHTGAQIADQQGAAVSYAVPEQASGIQADTAPELVVYPKSA